MILCKFRRSSQVSEVNGTESGFGMRRMCNIFLSSDILQRGCIGYPILDQHDTYIFVFCKESNLNFTVYKIQVSFICLILFQITYVIPLHRLFHYFTKFCKLYRQCFSPNEVCLTVLCFQLCITNTLNWNFCASSLIQDH